MGLKEGITILGEFTLSPKQVGAVAASWRALAREMVDWIDWPEVRTVIECGPGTGAFTRRIIERMRPDTRFMAIEINPRFAAVLRRRFPEVRAYEDSVGNVRQLCRREGIDQVDAIVCGLPWALFCEKDQLDFLLAVVDVLKPGGQFTTFAYWFGLLLPGGRRFSEMLCRHFSEVQRSRTAWLNLPPAFVYRCRR